MIPNVQKKLRVRIFIGERNRGMVWVPYKTLIGYTIRNRPIIGRLWETIYASDEFASKTEAIEKAKGEAGVRIMELFGHVNGADTEWEVIHECGPERVEVTYEASEATVTGSVATTAA